MNTHPFFQAFLPISLQVLHALLRSLTFWLTIVIAYARGCLAAKYTVCSASDCVFSNWQLYPIKCLQLP